MKNVGEKQVVLSGLRIWISFPSDSNGAFGSLGSRKHNDQTWGHTKVELQVRCSQGHGRASREFPDDRISKIERFPYNSQTVFQHPCFN